MGDGFKSFSTGDVLTAADMNGYLMKQAVAYFATTSARDTAITSPESGQMAAVTKQPWVYDGTDWLPVHPGEFISHSLTWTARTSDGDATNFQQGTTYDYPTLWFPFLHMEQIIADAGAWTLNANLRDTASGGGTRYTGVYWRNLGGNSRRSENGVPEASRSVAKDTNPTWYLYFDFGLSTPSTASPSSSEGTSSVAFYVIPDFGNLP